MSKKTLILTEKQLDEIANGVSAYLDGMATKPDMPDDFASQTSAEGSAGEGESYAKPIRTDDFSAEQARNSWPMGMKTFGKTAANIREMSKKDWENRYVLSEKKQHGNDELNNRTFDGYNYQQLEMQKQRYKDALEQSRSTDLATRQKGMASLQRMEKNRMSDNKGQALKMFDAAKTASHLHKNDIKSAPKPGVGKSHDKDIKNGIITMPKK